MTATSLIYVVGAGHSGSSLLDALLGSIRGTVGTGELNRLSLSPASRLCSCGVPLEACPWWLQVKRTAGAPRLSSMNAAVSARHDDGAMMTRLQQFRALRPSASRLHHVPPPYLHAARAAWEVVDAIARTAGAATVIDSTKTAARLALMADARPGEVFVVHLVRDPRAVVASDLRRTGTSVRSACLDWTLRNAVAHSAIRNHPVRGSIVVRYEELCRSPLETVRRVAAAADLEPPAALALPVEPAESHRVPGNPILTKPITEVRFDERWRSQLTKAQARAVASMTRWSDHRIARRERSSP